VPHSCGLSHEWGIAQSAIRRCSCPFSFARQRTVISTEDAHSLTVSIAVEKSASLPKTSPSHDISHYKGTHLIIPNPRAAPYPEKSMLPPRTLPGGRTTRQALSLGPNKLPLCRWCDLEILAKRRRTFCSDYCVHQWRLRTDPGYLRDQVFARDRGICAVCAIDTIAAYNALKRARGPARAAGLHLYGMKSITTRRSLWDADHIRPVAEGGGQCDLDNLRTLCLLCHREATARLRERLRLARAS
jgi:5-methylcytosine-specific restriction enzyme A